MSNYYNDLLDQIEEKMKHPGSETGMIATEYELWKYNSKFRLCIWYADEEITEDYTYNDLLYTLQTIRCFAEVSKLMWRMWNDESINLDQYIPYDGLHYSLEPVPEHEI